ncbi:MAG: hypothetical protein H6Q89_2970 [Myxococcaceae bacterium]|nr:hypothetical protein [Myxococcaceae bacterium]
MIRMFSAQKNAKVIALGTLSPSSEVPAASCPNEGQIASMNVLSASPPMNA